MPVPKEIGKPKYFDLGKSIVVKVSTAVLFKDVSMADELVLYVPAVAAKRMLKSVPLGEPAKKAKS